MTPDLGREYLITANERLRFVRQGKQFVVESDQFDHPEISKSHGLDHPNDAGYMLNFPDMNKLLIGGTSAGLFLIHRRRERLKTLDLARELTGYEIEGM